MLVAAFALTASFLPSILSPIFGGTDIGPLMRDGVIGAGVRTGGGRYFEWHHTAADTLDKVNLDDAAGVDLASADWLD